MAASACCAREMRGSIGARPLLKLEPRDQLSLARVAKNGADVDIAVAGDGPAVGVSGRRRQGIGGGWIIHFRPVEHVGELGADLEARAFLDPESTAEADVLHGPALVAEIGVISRRRSPLSRPGIGPSRRVKN